MLRQVAALGVVLASVPALAFAEEDPPSVYVEISEATRGGVDTPASATAEAVAHVLVGAGMPVRLGRARRDCGSACVHVTMRRDAQDRFVIDARYLGRSVETTLPVLASASIFDRSHALAVEIELLVQAALDRPATAARTRAPQPPPAPEELALEGSSTPPPDPARDAVLVSTDLDGHAPFPAATVTTPGAPLPTVAASASPARREHVAFQADAITLGTASGGLITFGLALALRVPIGERYDVRLGVALLDADRENGTTTPYWRKLNPISLYGTLAPEALPWLRLGAGLEVVAMVGDDLDEHHEPVLAWSYGAALHVEARIPVRSFIARLGLAAAVHPFEERLTEGEQVLMEYPRWTLGASLGLEFRLF